MSVNYVVDLAPTTHYESSIDFANGVASSPASGVIIGNIVDLIHANSYCNVYVVGGPNSGLLRVAIQTSDATTSGSFTDPTSGLPQFPSYVSSGGLLLVNSGTWTSGTHPAGSVDGQPPFCSGGIAFGAFLRQGRYARLIALSGVFTAPVGAGFVSQLKTVGSGTGFSYSPTSGVVSV